MEGYTMKKHFGLSHYFVFALAVTLCMPAHAMWRQAGQSTIAGVTRALATVARKTDKDFSSMAFNWGKGHAKELAIGTGLVAASAYGIYALYNWLTTDYQAKRAVVLIAHANVMGELKAKAKQKTQPEMPLSVVATCSPIPFNQAAYDQAIADRRKQNDGYRAFDYGPESEFHVPQDRIDSGSQKTQTEAHLSVFAPCRATPNEREDYPQIVDQAMAREQEHNDGYYVFYHAQELEYYVLQDFVKELYRILNLREPLDDFVFLRAWYEKVEGPKNPNEFTDAHKILLSSSSLPAIFGLDGFLSKQMLAVNLSLFGNSTKGSAGESTFYFFILSKGIHNFHAKDMIKDVFSHCGLNCAYVDRVLSLMQRIKTFKLPRGVLQQIFIPKEKVDKYVYLSRAYGTPLHKKVSTTLELFKNNPEQLTIDGEISSLRATKEPRQLDVDTLQARIVFLADGMLNPDSGIKIYRYTAIPDDVMATYEKELKQLVQEVATDLLARRLSCANLGSSKVYAGMGMNRLLGYLQSSK